MDTLFNVQTTMCCYSRLYSPSVWVLCFNACLFKASSWEAHCCGWSALTSLSRHRSQRLHISSAGFCRHVSPGGVSLRAETVSLWHHNFTEVLTARLQCLNGGCLHFSVDWAFLYFYNIYIAPWPAFIMKKKKKSQFPQYGTFKGALTIFGEEI